MYSFAEVKLYIYILVLKIVCNYVGMKTLQDWFGNCSAPRVGWQIDPFGHSRENARLFHWMGFDGLFFARNDYRDKEQRIINKTLDMIWNAGEYSVQILEFFCH